MNLLKGYNRKCEYCKDLAVHIHHKDRNRKNNHPDNLAYLCASHHAKEHYDAIDDEAMVNRSNDLVDEILEHKVGYRLTKGFFMLEMYD